MTHYKNHNEAFGPRNRKAYHYEEDFLRLGKSDFQWQLQTHKREGILDAIQVVWRYSQLPRKIVFPPVCGLFKCRRWEFSHSSIPPNTGLLFVSYIPGSNYKSSLPNYKTEPAHMCKELNFITCLTYSTSLTMPTRKQLLLKSMVFTPR